LSACRNRSLTGGATLEQIVVDLGIRAGRVITPEKEDSDIFVAVDGGLIRAVEPFHEGFQSRVKQFLDAREAILVPGFIDLQVNGGLGHNFRRADRAQRGAVYRFFLGLGTTTLVPTVVTDAPDVLAQALSALADDVGAGNPDQPGIPGLHLEGPFLNAERRGAHPAEYLRAPDLALARDLFASAWGRIAMVTVAPELPGADTLIRWFAQEGVIVAAGHTLASCDQLLRACDDGLTLLTHMGNVSDWPHRRKDATGIYRSEPGAVGAFMISERLRGTIILDGYHFDARLAAALTRLRGPRSIAIISDASYAAGCPPGNYGDGPIKTTVHPDGYAYATGGGGWLAGSVITLERAVQVAVQIGGIPLRDAIEMTTLTPASILGMEGRKGRIAPGYEADLVFLDQQLTVRRVIRAGREVK
jgi:N-acetylglucosamine-6-phosphate deacetylase